MDLSSRVTIIAIAVNEYSYLNRLYGPVKDVEKLKNVLCKHQLTAIFPETKFIALIDPDSDSLRREITKYALDRTAPNDILIFYFSGHGVPIGNNDYGFCTVDTQVHQEFKVPLPLNLVKFSDLIETLTSVKVDPVIIIDSCYSGQAGLTVNHLFEMLKRRIQTEAGSTYAILCSSTRIDPTADSSEGGPFTQIICKVATEGMGSKEFKVKYTLTLQDLFNSIKSEAEKDSDISPQLFLGATLPVFGIVKNTKYKPREETIAAHKGALHAFYNNGQPKKWKISELQKLGSTIHTTYKKLSYSPAWGLIEKTTSNQRQLTKRGLSFVNNKLKVASTIRKNPVSGIWESAPGDRYYNTCGNHIR